MDNLLFIVVGIHVILIAATIVSVLIGYILEYFKEHPWKQVVIGVLIINIVIFGTIGAAHLINGYFERFADVITIIENYHNRCLK